MTPDKKVSPPTAKSAIGRGIDDNKQGELLPFILQTKLNFCR